MKPLRLIALVLAVSAWCTAHALSAAACEKSAKSASAANAAGAKASCGAEATTASMASTPAASQCTAEMRAQCAKGASATAASMDHCAKGSKGAKSAKFTAASGCPMGASQCTAEMRAQCAKGTSATAASSDHCAKGATAKSAGGCSMHGTGTVADAGGCTAGAAMAHASCVICSDDIECQEALRHASTRAQVVALRNGAMLVYTADSPEGVRVLQATVARHHERVMSALAGSSEAALCGGCKEFRGAMASGKYVREMVNVKNGCQILLTSSDRTIVRRIHGMTGAQTAARVKS